MTVNKSRKFWIGFVHPKIKSPMKVIMEATDKRAPAGSASLTIGFTLALIHMISIPETNTLVNPARGTGPALLEGGVALDQVWLFWLAPIVGAVIGTAVYNFMGTVH